MRIDRQLLAITLILSTATLQGVPVFAEESIDELLPPGILLESSEYWERQSGPRTDQVDSAPWQGCTGSNNTQYDIQWQSK